MQSLIFIAMLSMRRKRRGIYPQRLKTAINAKNAPNRIGIGLNVPIQSEQYKE